MVEAERRGIQFPLDGETDKMQGHTAILYIITTIIIEYWSMILQQAISDQVVWEEHAHIIDPSIALHDYSGLVHTGKLIHYTIMQLFKTM